MIPALASQQKQGFLFPKNKKTNILTKHLLRRIEPDAAVDVISIAPHALKGQKLVAQGIALGIIAFRPAP